MIEMWFMDWILVLILCLSAVGGSCVFVGLLFEAYQTRRKSATPDESEDAQSAICVACLKDWIAKRRAYVCPSEPGGNLTAFQHGFHAAINELEQYISKPIEEETNGIDHSS